MIVAAVPLTDALTTVLMIPLHIHYLRLSLVAYDCQYAYHQAEQTFTSHRHGWGAHKPP